jgi:predicted nucleic acid-binding protein
VGRRRPLIRDDFASVLFDAGAVLSYAKDRPEVRAWVLRAEGADVPVRVSWITVAEIHRGSSTGSREQWVLSRLVPEELTLRDCKEAGALMGRTGCGGKTVDAILAATALRLPRPVAVLTGDGGDLGRLLEGEPRITVVHV